MSQTAYNQGCKDAQLALRSSVLALRNASVLTGEKPMDRVQIIAFHRENAQEHAHNSAVNHGIGEADYQLYKRGFLSGVEKFVTDEDF